MIRKASYDQDLKQTHKIINSAYDITMGSSGIACKKDPRWPQDMHHESIKRYMEDIYVYVENDEILGCIGVILNNDGVNIGPIAVSKEHQKRGIGSKLIEFAESFAKRTEIQVLDCRTDLIPLWENRNYKETRRENIENVFDIQGFSRSDVEVVFYEKVNNQ